MKKLLAMAAMAGAVSLGGCASPAEVDNMTVLGGYTDSQMAATPLHQKIGVESVAGGSETNPLWTSQVGNPEFQKAIELSLTSAGLAAPIQVAPGYTLDAQLINLSQPLVGISMTVQSTVNYILTQTSTSKVVYQKIIIAPYTATFSDSPIAIKRLRLANEGSIRENIKKLIADLYAWQPPK